MQQQRPRIVEQAAKNMVQRGMIRWAMIAATTEAKDGQRSSQKYGSARHDPMGVIAATTAAKYSQIRSPKYGSAWHDLMPMADAATAPKDSQTSSQNMIQRGMT